MKKYELVFDAPLVRRMPVVLRVDGRAFSKLSKKLDKPFDSRFTSAMDAVTHALCREIQGAVFGYYQSDEASILIVDYKNLASEPWFDGRVQKMCSIAGSIATLAFYKAFSSLPSKLFESLAFDARVFNVPREDATNYFIWRQRDCERNSVSMLASHHFSHKDLMGVKREEKIERLKFFKGIDWFDIAPALQRGACVSKETGVVTGSNVLRTHWKTDSDIPIFAQDREYIEKHLAVTDEKEQMKKNR